MAEASTFYHKNYTYSECLEFCNQELSSRILVFEIILQKSELWNNQRKCSHMTDLGVKFHFTSHMPFFCQPVPLSRYLIWWITIEDSDKSKQTWHRRDRVEIKVWDLSTTGWNQEVPELRYPMWPLTLQGLSSTTTLVQALDCWPKTICRVFEAPEHRLHWILALCSENLLEVPGAGNQT